MKPELIFTVSIGDSTEEALALACRHHLEALGYGVTEPNEAWETPSQCARRLGVHNNTVTLRLRKWERLGHRLVVDRPGGRRMTSFVSNPALDRFIRGGKG